MSDGKTSCFAIGCKLRIPMNRFGCRRHWFMLPRPFRDDVWDAYRIRDRTRTLELAREAMKIVRDKEIPV